MYFELNFTLLLSKQALAGILQLTWNQSSLLSRNNNVIADESGFQERIYDRKISLFTNLGTSR